jgi:hypothetical protein
MGRIRRMSMMRREKKTSSHVMIAFGGGLLMSHNMANKKLKALSKGGT